MVNIKINRNKMYKPIDLSGFPKEREQKLREINRYSLFEVMLYRSNLWGHTHRVLWLVEEILSAAEKCLKLDSTKARILALVHDDEEMITGDIPAGVKAAMSEEEKQQMWEDEKNAADTLAQKYPKEIDGYNYRAMLKHSADKDCIEAQLVSYLDKIDAYCESLHELFAGNISFLRSVVFYEKALPAFPIKYPALKPLFESQDSVLSSFRSTLPTNPVKVKDYVHLNKLHTEGSLIASTDFVFYNIWKEVVMEHGGRDQLLKQREYLPK
jgi:5'-deoxynucleotidase YfbR-like HD superfamily hydrolase